MELLAVTSLSLRSTFNPDRGRVQSQQGLDQIIPRRPRFTTYDSYGSHPLLPISKSFLRLWQLLNRRTKIMRQRLTYV